MADDVQRIVTPPLNGLWITGVGTCEYTHIVRTAFPFQSSSAFRSIAGCDFGLTRINGPGIRPRTALHPHRTTSSQ